MSPYPFPYLALAEWRRSVAENYSAVRAASHGDSAEACRPFRDRRDHLFRLHAQSPLTSHQRRDFHGLSYFPYDASWSTTGILHPRLPTTSSALLFDLDQPMELVHVADVQIALRDHAASLPIYWVGGYGGGLFLPFRDATNGGQTHHGGRYLYDTIKGADLGTNGHQINVDFNYAYNPSARITRAGRALSRHLPTD